MWQRVTSHLRRLRGLMLVGGLALGGSCYNPDLSAALYKCDTANVCPDGLSCIDNKHCTYVTPACNLGGIMIATDTFVCPGLGNDCQPGFSRCPTSVTTPLCHLDILSNGDAEHCDICCRNPDMAH